MLETPENTRNQGFDEKESQRLALKYKLEQKRDMHKQSQLQKTAQHDNINENKVRFADDRKRQEEQQKYVHATGFSAAPDKDDNWQTKQYRSDYIQNTYLQGFANLRSGIEQEKQLQLKKEEKVVLKKGQADKERIKAQNNPNYDSTKNPILQAARKQRKEVKDMMSSKTLTPEEKKRRFDELTGRIVTKNNDLYRYLYNRERSIQLSKESQKPRAERLKKQLTPEQRAFLNRREQEELKRIP